MMERKLFILALLCSLSFLGACSSSDNDDEDVSPPVDVYENVEAVDLGLSVKWASMNLLGLYQWGMIEPGSDGKYPYSGGSGHTFVDIGADISGTEYDAAHVKWGKGWRMPRAMELRELATQCLSENAVENGVKGKRFIGKNGNSIFLPYQGYVAALVNDQGRAGYYWSSIPYEPTWGYAFFMKIDDGGVRAFTSYNKGKPDDFPHKYYWFSIRPVMDK